MLRRLLKNGGAAMLSEILENARRNEEQRDPTQPAVSDLFACLRQTWYRRNGYEAPPHDSATLRKFDVGHAIEAQHLKRLREQGYLVMTDVLVALRVNLDGTLLGRIVPDGTDVWDDEISGHPDFWLPNERTLVEIKSTNVRKVEPQCKPHYQAQAAAYAFALDAQSAIVHVTHVANFDKDEAEYVVDLDAWRDRIANRVSAVLTQTGVGTAIPAAQPPEESAAWACKYCPHAQCEANQNKNAVDTTPVFL